MRKYVFIAIFAVLLVIPGCDATPEAKRAVKEASVTAAERSRNFEAIKSRITAVNPDDKELIEQWKQLHSDGLAAEAKALADLDWRLNGGKNPPAAPAPVAPKPLPETVKAEAQATDSIQKINDHFPEVEYE